MPDVYGRIPSAFGGAISADSTRIFFGAGANGANVVGMIAEGASLGYAQQVSRRYDLRDNKSYYIAGRTQGQGSFQQLFGFGSLISEFLKRYGDVCTIDQNNIRIQFSAGCGNTRPNTDVLAFTMQQVHVPQFQLQAQAESMEIRSQIALSFANLLED